MIRPKYEAAPKPTRAQSKAAYAAVAMRSGGICEGCGVVPAKNMHHRKFRSAGGHDTIENLLHLCGSGNVSGCHGIAHGAMKMQNGWSVAPWNDPTLVPVFHRRDSTWTRGIEVLNPIDAVEYMLLVGQMKSGLG